LDFNEHPVAYTADEYRPTYGHTTMKNPLDHLRFAQMENETLENLTWQDIIDVYYDAKKAIQNDPDALSHEPDHTAPLAIVDALSNIASPKTAKEKEELDNIFLDAFHEVAEHPDFITFKSFLTGIRGIDKITSKEHKLQALEIIEKVLGTLDEQDIATDPETNKSIYTQKIDPELKDIASRGLREYRVRLEHDQPASLEETVAKPAQHQIEMAIAQKAAEHEVSDNQLLHDFAGNEDKTTPILTSEQIEDALNDQMFAKLQDKRRQAEWDAYYASGGSPTEDPEGVMNPLRQMEDQIENIDEDSTGALIARQLEQLNARDNAENVSQKLLMHELGKKAAERSIADAERLKQAS
jgi:hypothetical protein